MTVMTNRKLDATFGPDPDLFMTQARYNASLSAQRQIKRVLESPEFRIKLRRVERAFANMRWALKNGSLSDDERLCIRWMTRHRNEGHMDLVEEDLLWLGNRLEKVPNIEVDRGML